MNSLNWVHMTWPQPWLSYSTSSSDNLLVTCCHTYRPQPIEHVRETIATNQTPQRQVEFPNTNIVRNALTLPNSLVIYWGGQSLWTHPYWSQPTHSHQQHSPTRAQLKGFLCSSAIPSSTRVMLFWAPLEGCYFELNLRNATCLTPIPSPTQGIRSELNSRNTNNPTFEAPPKAL